MQNANTSASYGFRVLVIVHLVCLYVLTFGMKNTLYGHSHNVLAIALTVLMTGIVALFVTDMLTRKETSRKFAKLVDGALGGAWLALMGFLLLQNLRSGIW